MESSLYSGMGSVLMANWGTRDISGVTGWEEAAEVAGADNISFKSKGCVVETRGDESTRAVQVILKYTFLPLVFFGFELCLYSTISSLALRFFSGSHELSLVGYPFHLTR